PALARLLGPPTHSIEVVRVEPGEIEAGLAVPREAGAGSEKEVGREPVGLIELARPLGLLPGPEPHEVDAVRGQVVQVRLVVEGDRRIPEAAVLEVRPGVRAGQIDDLTVGGSEIPGV